MQARKELERELRQRLPAPAWDYLVERRYVEEYVAGIMPLAELAEEAQALLNLRRTRMKPTRRPRRAEQRDLLSYRIARRGRDEPHVIEFRDRWLAAFAATQRDAHELMLVWAGNDRESRKWIPTLLDPGLFREHIPPRRLPRLPMLTRDVLDHLGMTVDRPLANAPVIGRAIGDLVVLVLGLAHDYPWSFGQATTFTLTDQVPDVAPIRAHWNAGACPDASRLTLVVDPLATNQELVSAVRDARSRYVHGRVPGVCARGQTLVEFVIDRPISESWAAVLAAWNRAYPHWLYSSENVIRRDAGKWHKKIYGVPLPSRRRSRRS